MVGRTLFSRAVLLVVVSLLWIGGAQAQENPPLRDPQALAARYLGFTGSAPTPPLAPIYKVGDKAQFWVGKIGSTVPVRVPATLAAAAPNVYLWVEDGIALGGDLTQTATQIGQIVSTLRQRDDYRQSISLPGLGSLSDPNSLLPVPDVDGDPHLYVLYTTNMSTDQDAVTNPIDSLPVQYAPYSNQHEMLYVNTTPYAGTPLIDPIYTGILARGIYGWIMNANVPQQAEWLTDALNWTVLFSLEQTRVGVENLSAYLQDPDTPLIQPTTITTQAQTLGGQQLFIGYFVQRYGTAPFTDLFLQPGSGIAPLDAVLAQHHISDPVSGAQVTGRDAFADFVMANGLDLAFGDGRYVESAIPLPPETLASGTTLTPKSDLSGLSVSQFGAQYFRYTQAQAGTIRLSFDGSPTAARLPMPADRAPTDHFYWSGHADNQNPTLTRAVDLSGVSAAALTFDAWYDLAPGWNYGYVSASTDGGATWTALTASSSSVDDPYGAAYGAGFTGTSNPAKPHAFPTLGIVVGGDGMTASAIVPGGPAAQAGVQPGDVIIGSDRQNWTGAPNVLGLLANDAPGDTLHLYVQRGSFRLDLPVVLGANPSRTVEPDPLWLHETVDLTPYAGKRILLRFETVTLPGDEDQGFAVDNLAIPAIHWSDDAEGAMSGWTADGWQQVDNQLPQQWIVQYGTSGTETTYPRVQTLIGADATTPSGTWSLPLDTGETITLAVSGVNDDTTERALFNLGFKSS